MGEKITINDYGLFKFIYRGGQTKNYFELYCTVTETDRKFVTLTDNFGQEFIVARKDIKGFLKCELVQQIDS